ncbi:hypothetical protein NST21_13530 [Peribacillus sp. FSL K6-1552]|uniref:hypothetical protein n=1 Tax=Peribacillus sp. FSL K6-1552 TaxID=2954514 RepID=UPI0030F52AF3
MISDDKKSRGQLKGYILEVVVRILLEKHGWYAIQEEVENKVKISGQEVEFRGRGTWHQIDVPCYFNRRIPYTYPLRLLGEVKFYSVEIQKEKIREYIGVMKDINENLFVDEDSLGQTRYTNIAVYFSASGFQEEAIKLAYAHEIKTVSYKNNMEFKHLRNFVEVLETVLPVSKTIVKGKRNVFLKDLDGLLRDFQQNIGVFSKKYFQGSKKPDFIARQNLERISNSLNQIQTSFLANSNSGIMLHILSQNEFPKDLFKKTDEQECTMNFTKMENDFNTWLEFSQDSNKRKYHFALPESLLRKLIKEEKIIFHFPYIIDNILRSLSLRFKKESIEKLIDEISKRKSSKKRKKD